MQEADQDRQEPQRLADRGRRDERLADAHRPVVRASWIAWPASCAATPTAASDDAWPTSALRFSVRLRGS